MKARDPEAARQRMADFDARVLPIILELRDKGMSINVIARKRGISQHGRGVHGRRTRCAGCWRGGAAVVDSGDCRRSACDVAP
jgi:hypothetical protein